MQVGLSKAVILQEMMKHRNNGVCTLTHIVCFINKIVHLLNNIHSMFHNPLLKLTCLGTASHETPNMAHLRGVRK